MNSKHRLNFEMEFLKNSTQEPIRSEFESGSGIGCYTNQKVIFRIPPRQKPDGCAKTTTDADLLQGASPKGLKTNAIRKKNF